MLFTWESRLFGSDLPKVMVEQTFDLSEAAKAQEISQHGHPRGKLVLQVIHES
jgi:NADPH:quinone reductase-like Zn-dependent oxidoreductase